MCDLTGLDVNMGMDIAAEEPRKESKEPGEGKPGDAGNELASEGGGLE